MRKYFTKMISIFLILCSFTMLTVYGAEVSISRKYDYQEKSNWCWAANSRNLVTGERSTNNKPVITQSEAVKYVKGSIVNEQGFLNDVVDAAEYINEGDYGYQLVTSPFSFTNLYNLVNSFNSPAYMSIQDKKNNYGHSILMYGANNSNKDLIIFNPANSNKGGDRRVNYDDLVDGTWDLYKGYVYDSTVYCTAHY